MAKKNKKLLVLIDSNALIHRAFHALPPLTKKDGTPTGAVYGYALTLFSVMEQLKPDYVVATFDLAGPTFRHEKFKDYKATRNKASDELYAQIPLVKEMLSSYGVPIYEKRGFEADDVIGTLAKAKNLDDSLEKMIVTGDLDTLQLIDEDTSVFTLRKGIKDTVIYDKERVRERFDGLEPDQIVDYKALRGDASDNIPGVKGVGEKTAINLLKEHKTLEGVYQNLEKIKPDGLRKKLEEGKEKAFLSYELATIDTKVSLEFDLEKADVANFDKKGLAGFFAQNEFHTLYKRIKEQNPEIQDGEQEKRSEEEMEEVITKAKEGGDFAKIISLAKKEKKIGYSLLVRGNNFYDAELLGAGICAGKEVCYFSAEKIDLLKELFFDQEILKIGFNVKFDIQLLWKRWLGVGDNQKLQAKAYEKEIFRSDYFFDVQLGAYVLGSSKPNDLEKLIFQEFGSEMKNKITKSGQASLLLDSHENELLHNAEKAFWLVKLQKVFQEKLEKESGKQETENKLAEVFRFLEMPLVNSLARMEIFGVATKKEKLEEVSGFAKKKLEKLEQEIYFHAGEKFNINSPSQLAPILYEKLKISTAEIKRGKTGLSTDADQLRKIRELHPIVVLIEQYRELFKIKTTYADSLPLLVADDGRIHAHFNQAVAATGRLSSSDPNMQNIPKKGKLADMIRQAFVAEKGKILVSADYSQIDLRVAAHLSGDPKMVEIFQKNQDVHRATAAWVNGIDQSQVSDKQRSEAKSLNFGILYGMGLYGFMRDSGVSGERAKEFMAEYMKTFSKLGEFIEQTKQFARSNGFVETELGRRRYIQNIGASNSMLRSAAERMAINLPIQGLAADIMKLAMIEVEKMLEEHNEEKLRAKMILQVHDEMIFEVEKDEAEEFMKKTKKIMESVYELKVPLVVDVSKGENWQEL